MKNIQDIAWEATQQLCGSLELEAAMNGFFQSLRDSMPLSHIMLGRFDEAGKQVFLISRTGPDGTIREFRSIPFTAEQLSIARAHDFFNTRKTADLLIEDPMHPLLPLYHYEGLPFSLPLFIHRLAHQNAFYGGGSFLFEPGSEVTKPMIAVIRAIEAPLSIFVNAWMQYWHLEQLKQQIHKENRTLRQRLSGLEQVSIIGATGGLKDCLEHARQVAPLDVSVLIRGETGTGKELLARALHDMSPQNTGPFMAVNCGAIPPSLIDSELFGYEKGAFTGATGQRKGRFERAGGGTLFLDEVAELPLEVQARLLRVLQERVIERVGGSDPIPVSFRLVAATHRNLERMVAAGEFREDLYYRLRVVSLSLPPLRERQQDIPLLLAHFLEQAANRFGVAVPTIPDAEMARLLSYDWPGNVRELQNIAEEALALCRGGALSFRFHQPRPTALLLPASGVPDAYPYTAMMKGYLERTLARCHGKIQGPGGAAELLGENYSTVRAKLRKYQVEHGRKSFFRGE